MLGQATNALRSATRSGTFGAFPRRVAPPSTFPWSPAFSVIEQAPGTFSTSLDPSTLKVSTATTYYVDGSRVNNSGTGLTKTDGFRSLWWPLVVGTGTMTIYVKGSADRNNPTVYPAADSWSGSSIAYNINVIVVSDFDTLAPGWAVSSTEDTPATSNGFSSVSGVSFYVERLAFAYAPNFAFYLQDFTVATFVDCDFSFGGQSGLTVATNVRASASRTVYLVRCRSFSNVNGDGFPYTAEGTGATLRVLEWNCEAYSNAGATSQGSSAHFTTGNAEVSVIRVGGVYRGNAAQEVSDVGGAKSWMLGCRLEGVDGAGIGVEIGDASTAWLHGCVVTGCATDLKTDNASGVINVSRSAYSTKSGPGTVQVYAP